jgi:hypothetical protein
MPAGKLLIEVLHRRKSCVRELETVARFGRNESIAIQVDLNILEIVLMSQPLGYLASLNVLTWPCMALPVIGDRNYLMIGEFSGLRNYPHNCENVDFHNGGDNLVRQH